MPTSHTDQFFVTDPANPPAGGATLTPSLFGFVDQDDDGRIDPDSGDSFNGIDITAVWRGDRMTVVMDGQQVTITGVTFYLANGAAVFTPTDGTILSEATFVSSRYVKKSTDVAVDQFGPPCFVAGTRILTATGLRRIETLAVGDLVETQDNGLQAIRWTGHRRVDGTGDHAPIRFAPGAMDNDRALLVSPQHRILVQGWRAELFFGAEEVFVPAKHLVNHDTVHVLPVETIDYHHILLDRHEIIEAEGVATESFHPGDTILMSDPRLRAEITALFPDLDPEAGAGRETARPVLRRREASVLSQAA